MELCESSLSLKTVLLGDQVGSPGFAYGGQMALPGLHGCAPATIHTPHTPGYLQTRI